MTLLSYCWYLYLLVQHTAKTNMEAVETLHVYMSTCLHVYVYHYLWKPVGNRPYLGH
jgi:hypothetical protein